ncbi:MAG: hypothetical protein IT200_03410 [Thermoleophilia bacterium]|nr:hypothetical protein [Thermoleophilia bacterium]
MDIPQQSPRERNDARLSRIKTGILVASAAAFAAIGGAVATSGDGGDSSAATQDAVRQQPQQDQGSFFGDDQNQGFQDGAPQDQGGFFAPGSDQSGAPAMRSGAS